eukprot:COSAG04_NODE_10233_length_794_cov_1.130935_1_plen_94_part_00
MRCALPNTNNLLAARFAYWVITTAWGLQEDPGRERAGEGRRRKVRNAAEMRAELPAIWAWFEATVPRCLSCPRPETLAALEAFGHDEEGEGEQ